MNSAYGRPSTCAENSHPGLQRKFVNLLTSGTDYLVNSEELPVPLTGQPSRNRGM